MSGGFVTPIHLSIHPASASHLSRCAASAPVLSRLRLQRGNPHVKGTNTSVTSDPRSQRTEDEQGRAHGKTQLAARPCDRSGSMGGMGLRPLSFWKKASSTGTNRSARPYLWSRVGATGRSAWNLAAIGFRLVQVADAVRE